MLTEGVHLSEKNEPDPLNPKIAYKAPENAKILHPFLKYDLTKLPISFSHKELSELVADIFDNFKTANKQRFQTYGGIGLQYAQGFDEYYDTLQDLMALQKVRPVADGDFRHINSIGERFKFVFDRFASEGIHLTRARLLIARPGHIHEPHFDYDFRIHIPITTNEKCQAIFGREIYHMPADGGSFLHNGYHQHTFRNFGETDRIHFVAGIHGYSLLHRSLMRAQEKS